MSDSSAVRALMAPRRSGEALVEPPLDAVAALLERNAELPKSRVELLGRSLADLAHLARTQMLDEAVRYSRQYRDVPDIAPHLPRIVLAGHQPELFHPGVWFKNFVLDRLARRHGAVAVNLVVDHDTCRQASIRVPTGSPHQPAVERVAFDAVVNAVPWEDRGIVDREVFRSFAQRAGTLLRPFVDEPLLEEVWPLAVDAMKRGAALGEALAQARHAFEGRIGLTTLEVPLSSLCRGEAFAWFAAWLLHEAPHVRAVYNDAVHAYRRANRVRSASHPVPDLAVDGEYCESPLWVWSRSNPRRRHAFVARRSGGMTLTDREGWTCDIPAADASPTAVVERLLALDGEGIRLRPRALTTTWYARTVLGDLFVHGIGGAKYDEVTDRIIADLFRIAPPAYLTATATLHLPVAHDAGASGKLREAKRRRRDLRYHAETVISSDDDHWRDAVRAKRACIDEFRRAAPLPWRREAARERHRAVAAANAAFAPWAANELRSLDTEESRLAERLRVEQILESREYAFCLFPRDAVVPMLSDLAGEGR
ncbi:MAG: hypothetical protein WD875_12130 [Pirellulales bacterium]